MMLVIQVGILEKVWEKGLQDSILNNSGKVTK